MKPALFLAFALAAASPALAQSANEAAQTEAQFFFADCAKVASGLHAQCVDNHDTFLKNYVRAKSGDVAYMSDIALRLDPDDGAPMPGPEVGLRARFKREACAWLLTISQSTLDPGRLAANRERWKGKCSEFPPNLVRGIEERAGQLLYELRRHPTKPPKEPPVVLGSTQRRCLDDSVCALGKDCPPPEPKPGCPSN